MSQRAFAESAGVTLSKLLYWLRKARSQDGAKAGFGGSRFVEVRREAESGAGGLVWLELGPVMSVCFESPPSPPYLAEVVLALSSLTRC
jgi:hypothetical protein